MKRVVSVSLGSHRRNQDLELDLLGLRLIVQRVGTGGNLDRMARILKTLDGEVDVLGLGGVNLTLRAGQRRYLLRDGARLAAQVRQTPLVDGSGIKDTVERELVPYLQKKLGWPRRGQVVLMVSVLDRYGLADALEQAGCRLII
ncbi:MAG TPA: quinate 5-dehydrogenase, partial [Firmicutes bacterium]|nr:quinate 5-dehydrogenase [Bacillota bacterium]